MDWKARNVETRDDLISPAKSATTFRFPGYIYVSIDRLKDLVLGIRIDFILSFVKLRLSV